MARTTTTEARIEPAVEATFDLEAWTRAWHGTLPGHHEAPADVKDATLTICRDSDNDCQDRQVYIYVDGECWGKIRYGLAALLLGLPLPIVLIAFLAPGCGSR